MTTTSEYYNVVLNPDDVPVIGIDNTVERPPPLPEPEPEPRTIIHFDIRTIEIRKIYKFLHLIMFLLTFMYSLMTIEEEGGHLVVIDMIMSATSYFSVLENNINTLKIHVMYLAINFTFASYYLYFECIAYYFLYTILDICTIIHLILDRRDYYIDHLISVHSNP